MPSDNYKLYTRPDCHLCELAQDLLTSAGLAAQVTVTDIECDLALIRQYGERIPVLYDAERGKSLDWPFDLDRLTDWLR